MKGLKLINVKFNLANNDVRPAFVCEDGKDITVTGWKIPATTGAEAIIRLENVQSADITKMEAKGEAESFVRVEGRSNDVKIKNNTTSPGIKKTMETGADNTLPVNY